MRPNNTHLSNPIHIIPVFHWPPFVACQHACGILTLCIHGGNIYFNFNQMRDSQRRVGINLLLGHDSRLLYIQVECLVSNQTT